MAPRGRHRRRLVTALIAVFVILALGTPVPGPFASPPVADAAPADANPAADYSGPVPIVIVFDLSSSMTEDDGSGTVKLAGAKRSLKTLVDRQPPNTEIGLWTYPTARDSCSPGGFVYGSTLRAVPDPSQLSATIDGLQANGDTPTGDALRAAADAVRSQGRNAATIVLVSDGESNCGNDPCAVAKSISAEGFDITVQAMGFQISDEGRDELECIAEATQGAYYDVSDSEQLSDKLGELSVPAVSLEVSASSTAPSGGTTTISATVSNPSVQTLENVMVGLQFRRGDNKTAVMPAVIPPRYRLGTLAPGATSTRTWTMSTTEAGVPGYMHWSVGAWGDTTLPIRKKGTIEITDGQRPVQGGELLAEIKASEHPALIMGDSFSSGEGTRDYLPSDNNFAQMCHRSNKQYAARLMENGATNSEVINIACSGAVVNDLISPQTGDGGTWKTSKGQLQILDDTEAPSAVFMTLGGNDIGFGNIATTCLLETSCQENESVVTGRDRGLVTLDSLNKYYNNVFRVANTDKKRRARDGDIAPVIVSAYPQITPPAERADCDDLDRPEVEFINRTIAALNYKIRIEVAQAWADGSEVYLVDDTTQAMAPDHYMCDDVPYAVPATLLAGGWNKAGDWVRNGGFWQGEVASGRANELAHPNVAGHNAMAGAIAAWSSKVQLDQRPVYKDVPDPTFNLSGGSQTPDQREGVDADPMEKRVFEAGEPVAGRWQDDDWAAAPLTPMSVWMASEPRLLAVSNADVDGNVDLRFTIPADTPAGIHHLTFAGVDADGGYHETVLEIRVKGPIPWWYWGIAVATVLSALGAIVALWQARRFR